MQRVDQIANMYSGEQFQATAMNTTLHHDKKLTINIDNTVNQFGQQIANMMMLIHG